MAVEYALFSYELNVSSADGPKIQFSQVSYMIHEFPRIEHYRLDNLPFMSYAV